MRNQSLVLWGAVLSAVVGIAGCSDSNSGGTVFASGSTEDAGDTGGAGGEHSTGSGGKTNTGGSNGSHDAGTHPDTDAMPAMDGGSPDGSAADGSAGGATSDASASGGTTGSGGATGAGGTPETGGGTGTGGASTGGTSGAGGTVGDGGSSSTGGTGGCANLKTYYPDGDHDNYGRSTGSVTACAPPGGTGWSLASGDCDDDDDRVHPGQGTYFDTPYTRQSADSYDYDCSNDEDGDPTQEGMAPVCGILSVVGCSGSGFQATARIGTGKNSLCGSKTKVTCQVSGIACNSVTTSVQDGYRCH